MSDTEISRHQSPLSSSQFDEASYHHVLPRTYSGKELAMNLTLKFFKKGLIDPSDFEDAEDILSLTCARVTVEVMGIS